MDDHRFRNDVANAPAAVKRREWILEDHLQAWLAASCTYTRKADLAGCRRHQPSHHSGQSGFSTSTLADEFVSLAASDGETNGINCQCSRLLLGTWEPQPKRPGLEDPADGVNFEQFGIVHQSPSQFTGCQQA